ncbi:MFS transporter [Amycolatopsis suaedae]|uniref:MFS transporter n=1 Tax=Amycolatopsis suaedae TaxID=2510978 RepID=UPI001F0D5A76|nr:MFS transporter [Amycolatopsis suaedae]
MASAAQFTTALEFSVVYLALPSIGADLAASPALVAWVVNAYAVLFAGFLVLGGRLADRVGYRRQFVCAMVAFGAASALAGLAGDAGVLIVARAAQGLSIALLQPAVLGLLGTSFPAGAARDRALTVWSSVGAVGLAAGAVLGGMLAATSWRLVFLLNVPLTLACALGALALTGLPRGRPARRPFPVFASLLATAGVLVLALGLTFGGEWGWGSAPAVGCVLAGGVLMVAFAAHERRGTTVLIESVLRQSASLRLGAAATAFFMASVGAEYYLVTLLMQNAWGYTAVQAGVAFLPLALLVTAGSAAGGPAVRRWGAAATLATGFGISAPGLALLAFTVAGDSYLLHLLPGLVLSGFGNGLVFTSMFALGTRAVPAVRHGTAGALLTTSQYLAGALALAVLTVVLGRAPERADFQSAFLLTAAVAVAGMLTVLARSPRGA